MLREKCLAKAEVTIVVKLSFISLHRTSAYLERYCHMSKQSLKFSEIVPPVFQFTMQSHRTTWANRFLADISLHLSSNKSGKDSYVILSWHCLMSSLINMVLHSMLLGMKVNVGQLVKRKYFTAGFLDLDRTGFKQTLKSKEQLLGNSAK